MSRVCKAIGTVLLAVGIIALVAFTSFVLGDEDFQRAQLVKERNPGNVMYESRYFVALTAHTFLIGGALCGGLVALNGLTLLLLGIVVQRQGQLRTGVARGGL